MRPKETRRFTLTVGERRIPKREEYRAYGRFNRERRDDFAWENDRVAHRMYGAALETWAQEPLTSSGLDVWVKRTRRLVINDWYMVDDYHRDTGEGADLYSAGRTRGCGGSGLMVGGKLFSPPNFRNTRVLAQGPIRVMFELMYEPWDAGGAKVTETRRVTLDAGSHVNTFELTFQPAPPAWDRARRRRADQSRAVGAADARRGRSAYLGAAETGRPSRVRGDRAGDDAARWSSTAAPWRWRRSPARGATTYYSASAWDRGGDIKDVAAFDAYLAREARRRQAPVRIQIESRK